MRHSFRTFAFIQTVVLATLAVAGGCRWSRTEPARAARPDGTYRGVSIDGDAIRVNVEQGAL